MVIAALSLLGSVFLSATANGIAVFMVFGAGLAAGLLGQIGDALDVETLENVAKVTSWLLPFEALYQAGLHSLTEDVGGVTGVIVQLGPFGGAPGRRTGLWLWTLAYLALVARRPGPRSRGATCSAAGPGSILDRWGRPATETLLEGLNESQREAVLHGEGPCSSSPARAPGKTRVLTHRIAHLVGTGQARPGEILAITFTNKAAQEMRERVEELVGQPRPGDVGDDLPLGLRAMLRADAEKLGYTRGFTIYDEQDSLRLVKTCIDELDIDPKRFAPRGIRRQISDAKNQLLDAEAYRLKVSSFFEQTAADVYDLYEKRLHAANAMDFDDLLFRCGEPLRALRGRPRPLPPLVPPRAGRRVPGHQPRPVPLAPAADEEHRNLCVVGDDDQCLVGGHAGHDGRRLDEALERGRARRRGAVQATERRPPSRSSHRDHRWMA